MNPPYTRQEWLDAGQKDGRQGLDGRAGLHARFWMHLAGFVRQGGWLGVITSATWLSAGFGHGLRAILLEHFRIHLLVQFGADVFPDACVEACVAILEKRSGAAEAGARAETPVRFLRLAAAASPSAVTEAALRREASGEGDGYRLRVVPQSDLAGERRWNRFFVASPYAARVAAAPTMVPLASLAGIRRGITTGRNHVFLPDRETVARWGIEARFLHPFLRSPRDIPGLDTGEVAEPAWLLLPPYPDEAGSRAAAYLRAQGASGSPYLPRALPAPAPLLFGYAVRARKAFFRNSAGLPASDNFFCLTPRREEDLLILFALLNAVPAALLLEVLGRAQGGGLLKIQRYELADLRVPDPARLDASLCRELVALGDALRLSPANEELRAALDRAAALALGMDATALRRAEQELAALRKRGRGSWDASRNNCRIRSRGV